MKFALRSMLVLGALAFVLSMSGCGGSDDSGGDGAGDGGGNTANDTDSGSGNGAANEE